METPFHYEVLVIGAGAAGLMAARTLVQAGKKVAVIEAEGRPGGRIHTVHPAGFPYPVELGAEFIHGRLPLTLSLLEEANLRYTEVSGTIWQKEGGRWKQRDSFIDHEELILQKSKTLQYDIPVSQFLAAHFNDNKWDSLRREIKNYVEGYYAADLSKTSTFALRTELEKGEEANYRVEGGYQSLITYLEASCRKDGCSFYYSTEVEQIDWKKDNIFLRTAQGPVFSGTKAILTVPLGVLQSGKIRFSPALPQKDSAAQSLGFGSVVKLILLFRSRFWGDKEKVKKELPDLGFLFSDEPVPTWWTQHPQNDTSLTGWLAGPPAEALAALDDEAIAQKALHSLTSLFEVADSFLKEQLFAIYIARWSKASPSKGAYSYEVIEGQRHQQVLKEPVVNTLFFAGEGLYEGPQIGTVEAALQSGQQTAHLLLTS